LRVHIHVLGNVWLGHTRIHVKTRKTVELSTFVIPQLAAGKVGDTAVFQNVFFAVTKARSILRLNVGSSREQNAEKHSGEE
jgi:hypothetical protein